MSTRTKAAFWVIIAFMVIVGGLLGWWNLSRQNAVQSPVPATGTSTNTPGAPASADSSDQGINQSLANIDTQMKGLSTDTATVNQGFNDQPVSQQPF